MIQLKEKLLKVNGDGVAPITSASAVIVNTNKPEGSNSTLQDVLDNGGVGIAKNGVLFSELTFFEGYYDPNTGGIGGSTTTKRTDKLPIDDTVKESGSRELYVTQDGVQVAGVKCRFFNINNEFISSTDTSATEKTIVPQSATNVGIHVQLATFPESIFDRMKIYGAFNIEKPRIENDTNINMMVPTNGGFIFDEGSKFCLIGASFATTNNGWFEIACAKLGVTPLNKAISGSQIGTFADKMYNGTLWENNEFDETDLLVIMVTHNLDVVDPLLVQGDFSKYTPPFTSTNIGMSARAWDYLIRKYRSDCYEQRNVVGSKWHNTKYGKPAQIAIMSHWHDGRTLYNESVRRLCARWRIPLIAIDENIGFTRNKPLENGNQISTVFASDSELINEVSYGQHPLTGQSQYIQKKMAKIFVKTVGG